MSRFGIVSPMPVVPGCRLHVEEGRGRGSLSIFLLIPEDPPDALAHALEILHDPRGPADLDQRLGRLAAVSPVGTSFVIALDRHVWTYPSRETELRLLRDGAIETLTEPQVVRLGDEDRIEVIATRTGEAIALAGNAHVPEPAPAPVRAPEPRVFERLRRHRAAPRAAALLGGSAALVVFALFRVFAAKPADPPRDPAREDAYVEPDLNRSELRLDAESSRSKGDDRVGSLLSTPDGATPPEGAPPESLAKHLANETANDASTGPGTEWTFRARAAITSSPLVVGGAVVFGSRDSTLYCLDAESGAAKWALPAGSGVGSSPRAARGIVVVGTYAGRVLAADLKTGKRKWEGRTGGKIVASACLLEDLAIVGSSDQRVHAFRLGSGEKAWTYEANAPFRASAEAIGADGVVVGSSEGMIHAIDAARGRALWTKSAGSGIVASAAYDEASNRIVVGTENGTVLCLGADDGHVVWKTKLDGTIHARPRITGETALVGTGKGTLFALDLETGKERWTLRGKRGFDATPAVVEKTVVAPAFDGTVHFVSLENGSPQGTRALGSQIWTSPALGREVVYVGTFGGTLYALALP